MFLIQKAQVTGAYLESGFLEIILRENVIKLNCDNFYALSNYVSQCISLMHITSHTL